MQIASRLDIRVQQVENVIIWGNHSSTQYPDVNHGTIDLPDGRVPIRQAVKDDDWLNGDFVKVSRISRFSVLSGYAINWYYLFIFMYSGVHLVVKSNFHFNGFYLRNRFHVTMHLFSNRSQMTSKCSKNKKEAHKAIAKCVTDVLTTF